MSEKNLPLVPFCCKPKRCEKRRNNLEGFSEKFGSRSVAFPERCRILPGFSGKWRVALQKSKNRFTARGGARLPARPMHRANRLAKPRPMVPHMPRSPPPAPRGEGATANPHPAPLGAKLFEKVALQPQNFEAEKIGLKVFPDFWDNGSKPWPIFPHFCEKRTFFGGNRKAMKQSFQSISSPPGPTLQQALVPVGGGLYLMPMPLRTS